MPDYPDETQTALDPRQAYAEWVQSLKSLDSDSWTVLLENFAPTLRKQIQESLLKRNLPRELVDDIEQETWLTAIKKIDEFVWEDEDKFQHWLRSISFNHVRTYGRKLGGSLSYDDFFDNDADSGLDAFLDAYIWNDATIEDRVILIERMAVLDRVLQTLSPKEQEIVMRRIIGETPRELGPQYNMEPHSISMLFWRVKKEIKAQLPPDWKDDSDD